MTNSQPPYDGNSPETGPVPSPWDIPGDDVPAGAAASGQQDGPGVWGGGPGPLPPEVLARSVQFDKPDPGRVPSGGGGRSSSDAVRAAEEIFASEPGPQDAAYVPGASGAPSSPGSQQPASGLSAQQLEQMAKDVRKEQKARDRAAKQAAKAQKPKRRPKKKENGAARTAAGGARFDVPRPGGRLRGGRGAHVAARMTALVTVSVVALGAVGVAAYTAGHPAPVTAGVTAQQVTQYRLTKFPLQQAIAFADRYARLCANQNPDTAQQRSDAIARLSSPGVDSTCGWDGKGTEVVAYSMFSGYTEPIGQYGDHAYYIGIQLQMTTGVLRTLSVPVYVDDLATGNGMRVVGDVGTIPQPDQATAPQVKDPAQVDSQLSTRLQGELFQDFFAAWGGSNSTNLTRYATPDASTSVRAGLRGVLQNPNVTDVQVLLPDGVSATDQHTWRVKDTTWAWVSVTWASGGSHVTEHYRVQIVLTDQGWFVRDIRAGVPDEGDSASTS